MDGRGSGSNIRDEMHIVSNRNDGHRVGGIIWSNAAGSVIVGRILKMKGCIIGNRGRIVEGRESGSGSVGGIYFSGFFFYNGVSERNFDRKEIIFWSLVDRDITRRIDVGIIFENICAWMYIYTAMIFNGV